MIKYLLFAFMFFSFFLSAQDSTYWDGERRLDGGRGNSYSSALHNQLPSIKAEYEENGDFYYSDFDNSFGFREILKPQQEMIFCGPNDVNFSDLIARVAASGRQSGYTDIPDLSAGQGAWTNGVKHSSTTMGMPFFSFLDEVEKALRDDNSNAQAKGRFCYKANRVGCENCADPRVDYRNSGAADEVYCEKDQLSEIYTDPVSGFSCQLQLDVNLKLNEIRQVSQPQSNQITVGTGFLGCYSNSVTGNAELVLIADPESCSPSSRGDCNRKCDWAQDVVCYARDIPRWGPGGACGGYGTTSFKDDITEVSASPQLSFDQDSGLLYEGNALMACLVTGVGESRRANWRLLTGSTCDPVSQ